MAKDSEDTTQAHLRREQALTMQAMQRLAEPDDIAGVIAFLASADARWITGEIVNVDGGSRL